MRLALLIALGVSGCTLVRSPTFVETDAGVDAPGLDAPGLDVPAPDVPAPDVPPFDADLDASGLDAPDAPGADTPDAPGCVPSGPMESDCDRVDDDCDGVVDDDDVCGCVAFAALGRAYLSCPAASGLEAWGGACGRNARGYDLVSFSGSAEQRAVLDAMAAAGVTMPQWIGLNDFVSNGEYVWRDGATTFAPSDVGANDPVKRCVMLRPTGEYEELPCGDDHEVLCEAEVPAGACAAEGASCDGVDDDCDGTADDGLDCGFGCRAFTFWRSVYYQCDDTQAWDGAEGSCSSLGAVLASVNGPTEQALLEASTPESWVGMRQRSATTPAMGWQWADGTSTFGLPPSGWRGGEPNDTDDTENRQQDCGSFRNDGDLEDDACMDTHAFLCERDWSWPR